MKDPHKQQDLSLFWSLLVLLIMAGLCLAIYLKRP